MAKTLKSTDGFIFHGWMRTKLRLTGGELMAFALVHQFSQSDAGRYLGGPGYLAAWLGCSDNTARKYLHSLLEKGLIINEDQEVNGVIFRYYRVNYDALQKFEYPSKNLGDPIKKFGVDNKIDNNSSKEEINISIPQTPIKFSFLGGLRCLGVSKETAEAWMQVRKAKKAVNTEIAFQAVVREVEKAGAAGHTAEDCIRLAVEKSWCGFKADWMENEQAGRSTRSTCSTPGTERNGGSRSRNSMEHLLALGMEMFGPQNPGCDEQ